MSGRNRKIINDPVHGFITLDDPVISAIVAHPWYQRLRRIHQMAFAHLVYPGAVHSRLLHSLGAYHLMGCALSELKQKGVHISAEEERAAKIAILLHDVGHGPFSHALEHMLIEGAHHEDLSIAIMNELNKEFKGALDLAIEIFSGRYHRKFLNQLISGQLDVDRMDYLSRDSFFTGVSEGVIGYDRILKMIAVYNGELVVEEKGIYSIEKFLVSRRLMFWQVYLHKTVLGAEMLLMKILERAKELIHRGTEVLGATTAINYFLQEKRDVSSLREHLPMFCQLDDTDITASFKNWCFHSDKILSDLSKFLTNRELFKVKLQANPMKEEEIEKLREAICREKGISKEESRYYIFYGEVANTTYDAAEERINILFKDGSIKDISEVDHALIQQTLSDPMKKFYICYPNPIPGNR